MCDGIYALWGYGDNLETDLMGRKRLREIFFIQREDTHCNLVDFCCAMCGVGVMTGAVEQLSF